MEKFDFNKFLMWLGLTILFFWFLVKLVLSIIHFSAYIIIIKFISILLVIIIITHTIIKVDKNFSKDKLKY